MSEDTDQGAQTEHTQSHGEVRQPQTYNQIAAAHIDRLNEVNRQLPKVLTYFATALTQLTNNPIQSGDQESEEDSKAARQSAFRKYTLFVGVLVAQIRDELTDQINDLERYKVIPKSQPKFTTQAPKGESEDERKKKNETQDLEGSVINGGYGNFDIGVLNARASTGQIGGGDVLDRVKEILEELMKRSENDSEGERMNTED